MSGLRLRFPTVMIVACTGVSLLAINAASAQPGHSDVNAGKPSAKKSALHPRTPSRPTGQHAPHRTLPLGGEAKPFQFAPPRLQTV